MAKNILKVIGLVFLWIMIIAIPIVMGLTPLWVWIDNGHSIYGGINDTPLSFGLGFIGTFFAISNGGIISVAK